VLWFFLIALLQAIVNGGIPNFGKLIVKGFGYTACKILLLLMPSNWGQVLKFIVGTTLLQIPYGVFIALVILFCVWINDKMLPNSRCLMILIFPISLQHLVCDLYPGAPKWDDLFATM
jgi:hypothetical protein